MDDDQNEREFQTVSAIQRALEKVYWKGSVEPLPRADTAHRFLVHIPSPSAGVPGRTMKFAILDGTLAEMTMIGRYLDDEGGERYLRSHDAFESLERTGECTL